MHLQGVLYASVVKKRQKYRTMKQKKQQLFVSLALGNSFFGIIVNRITLDKAFYSFDALTQAFSQKWLRVITKGNNTKKNMISNNFNSLAWWLSCAKIFKVFPEC